MNDIDDQIRRALTTEHPEGPPTIMDRVGSMFHAHARSLMVIGWVKMFFFVAIAAVAAVMFFRAADTRAQIAWATLFLLMASSLGTAFVIYWLELHRLAVMREIKRLELQVSRLSGRA